MSIKAKLIHALGGITSEESQHAIKVAHNLGREEQRADTEDVRKAIARAAGRVNEREVVRLTQAMFDLFKKSVLVGSVSLTERTTELQAGHIIGVNHALNTLRDGFVIESAQATKPV